MINRVFMSKLASRQLARVPRYISEKLKWWIESVEVDGLEEIRKIPGYHDEPLKGFRAGQRSIRLNNSYRAIYILLKDEKIEFIVIEEVTKHGY